MLAEVLEQDLRTFTVPDINPSVAGSWRGWEADPRAICQGQGSRQSLTSMARCQRCAIWSCHCGAKGWQPTFAGGRHNGTSGAPILGEAPKEPWAADQAEPLLLVSFSNGNLIQD